MLEPGEVSAVVLNYARPWNVARIVKHLANFGFGEVVIADNSGKGISCEHISSVVDYCRRVHLRECETGLGPDGPGNPMTGSRYMVMSECQSDYVYVQDDDYLVSNTGLRRILTAFDGKRPVCQCPDWTNRLSQCHALPFVDVGYGSIVNKNVMNMTGAIMAKGLFPLGVSMVDFMIHADRCFMTGLGDWECIQANSSCISRLSNPNGTESDTDENSIHLRPGHHASSMGAVGKCLEIRRLVEEKLSSYGYKTLAEFLYRTQCGRLRPDVLASLTSTLASVTPATS